MNGRLAAAALVALAISCGASDAADREYLAALGGEETGMTREQQIEHVGRAIQMAPKRPHYYEACAICRIDLEPFAQARRDLDRDRSAPMAGRGAFTPRQGTRATGMWQPPRAGRRVLTISSACVRLVPEGRRDAPSSPSGFSGQRAGEREHHTGTDACPGKHQPSIWLV